MSRRVKLRLVSLASNLVAMLVTGNFKDLEVIAVVLREALTIVEQEINRNGGVSPSFQHYANAGMIDTHFMGNDVDDDDDFVAVV